DRPLLEVAQQARVVLQLAAIALDLAVEERVEPAALVRARLVVDDPAGSRFVDEDAIDAVLAHHPGLERRDRELVARFGVIAQEPAAALVGERVAQRGDDALARGVAGLRVEAL